jgi:PAS domain S-box-containing protein
MATKSLGFFKTLQAQVLLALILIGLIPYLIFSLVLIDRESRLLRTQATRELTSAASRFAAELNRLLDNDLRNSRALAALPAIRSMDQTQQAPLLRELQKQFQYAQIGIADLNGQLLVASIDMELVSVAHIESFQRAATGEQGWVIAPGLFNPALLFHMHTPIFDEQEQLVGVLGSPVTLPRLAEELQRMSAGIAGRVFILHSDNRVLIHPDPAEIEWRRDLTAWINQPSEAGATEFDLYSEEEIAGYAPVPAFGWTVIVARPKAAVLAPVTTARTWTVAGLAAILGLSIALAFLLSRSLTRPVRDLAIAAQALGAGTPTALPTPQAQRTHEMATLVDSFATMHHNVLEREQRLRHSEARNRAMVNAIPDLLIRLAPDDRVIDAQGPVAPFAFGAAANLIGQSVGQLQQATPYQAFFAALSATAAEARATNRVARCECQEQVHDQRVDLELRAIGSGENEVVVIVRNVTDRNAAERTIRRHLSALAASIDGMAILSGDLCVYANTALAQLHGFRDSQQLIGQPWSVLYPAGEDERLRQEILPLVRQQGLWRGEARARRQDASTYPQEISLTQIDGGEIVLVARDLTERKQAELMLQQAQKRESLGILAGGVAHDFNNLLTGMFGQISLAQAALLPSDPTQTHLQKALVSAERAADLTRQLLAYAGKGRFYTEVFNLNELLRENMALLETALPRLATLDLELEPTLPPIKADRGQIQQVVMNLVINAAEALPSGRGLVRIQTLLMHQLTSASPNCVETPTQASLIHGELVSGLYVCLKVIDNGTGMTDETLRRIFDPFFSTKPHGSGLGLSATLGIVQKHQGAVHVLSMPGQGSTFCIFLPATTEMTIVKPLTTKPPRHILTSNVLVVDDEATVRDLCKDILEHAGAHVMTAENGQEALALFAAHRGDIDLVLLDILMPVLKGTEVVPELKRLRPDIPIILSSGYTEAETPEGMVDRQTVHFLQKPYPPAKLLELAAVLVQRVEHPTPLQ